MFGHREKCRRAVPYSGTVPVFLLALAFLIAPACLAASGAIEGETLPPSNWGGRGAELRIGDALAVIEFDCAFGRIPTPIAIQPDGSFAVDGLYLPERGGPGRAGDPEPEGEPAVYAGVRKNSNIHLTVRLIETGRTIGPFVLQLSKQPQLEKCL